MTKSENYLIVATEECAEVQHAILKGVRFGMVNKCIEDGSVHDNATDALTEFYQLTAMIEQLQLLGVLPEMSPEQIQGIKSNKLAAVEKYWREGQERLGD